MTSTRLWLFLAVALPVLASLLAPMSTVDLAYEIRAGELMLTNGAVLRTDPFLFTTGGGPWLNQQWGAELFFGAIFRLGGWSALAILRAALVGLTMALVLVAIRTQGADRRTAALLTLGGFVVAAAALALRSQLIGIVLFAATLAILASRWSHPRRIWLIPLLVVVWANTHGSFVLGPAAVGVAWLEDVAARRPGSSRLLAVGLATLVATAIGPFGPSVWAYALGLGANPVIRRIVTEWQPTTPFDPIGVVVYGSGLIALAICVWIGRREHWSIRVPGRVPWPRLAWLIGLFGLAVAAQRGIAWWALAAPVGLAGIITPHVRVAEPEADSSRRTGRINLAIATTLTLAGVALLPSWRPSDPLAGPVGVLTDAPTGIARALAAIATPKDRVWNAQAWGSWLELTVPGVPLAVDSRIELVPPAVWDDVLAVDAGTPTWPAILDRYGVTIVVANATEQGRLLPDLRQSSAWHALYTDGNGTIFTRAKRGS